MKAHERDTVLRLIQPQLISKTIKRDSSKILMEGVCTGLTPSLQSVFSLSQSLLYPTYKAGDTVVSDLIRSSLISGSSSDDGEEIISKLAPTQLGQAVLASSLPPDAALFVFSDLQRAARALAIDTELHMLYLVTPANCSIWQGCDWHNLHKVFVTLEADSKRIAKMVGANEQFIIGRVQQRAIQSTDRDLQLHLRFFSSLALFDLVNEKPLAEVASRFQIPRGSLQTLQQQSATYAAMVVAFCSRLGWQYFRSLLDNFALRLAFGVRAELTELVRIDGIDGSRARIFHEKNISSLAQLSNSTVEEVTNVLSLAVPYDDSNVNDGKNEWLLGEERTTLMEAAEILISRADLLLQEQLKSLGFNMSAIVIKRKKTVRGDANTQKSNAPSQQEVSKTLSSQEDLYSYNNTASDDNSDLSASFIKDSQSSQESGYGRSSPLKPSSQNSFSENSDSFEDASIDLFSNTMLELSLNDNVEKDSAHVVTGEVDDLETSLMISHSILRNSMESEDNKENVVFEDSFDIPLQFKSPCVPTWSQNSSRRLSNTSSLNTVAETSMEERNTSVDLFDDCSPLATKLKKRLSRSIWSPSVASPVSKYSRRPVFPSKTLIVNDVCSSSSMWKQFVSRSLNWTRLGISIITDKRSEEVIAIALCGDDCVDFLPLADDYFPGNAAEEAIAPSATPNENITVEMKKNQLSLILTSCTVFAFDALEVGMKIYKTLRILIENIHCIEFLSFLALYRNGDNPIPLVQVVSKFDWVFDVSSHFNRGPRIKCSIEAHVLSQLFDKIRPIAVKLSTESSISLETSSVSVFLKMICSGIAFSQEKCKKELYRIREKMDVLEAECQIIAHRNFNLDSPSQVSEVLFSNLKIPHPGGRGNTRHLPTNKAVLESLRADYPIVENILTFRSLKHTVSQCLLPLSKCVDEDGRIRTSMLICTATGRILSNRPNVQTVPKGKDEFSFSGRSLFATSSQYSLIAADYCQLELRVLAHLSGDKLLCSRLGNEERDFFKDLSREWGFSRDCVKQLCYGIIYGMGVRSLADATSSSVENAQKLIDSFFKSFPAVQSYINNTREMSSKAGFVTTMLGRRRLTKSRGKQDEKAQDDRQSINFTIQGTASEIFKQALLNINKSIKGLDCHLVMTVHDEVLIECHDSILDIVKAKIKTSMQTVFPLRVPLRVKIISGPDWGSYHRNMAFEMRNVICDYSLGPPNQINAQIFETNCSVPTLHIFGITKEGRKACVHVHGVLPYLFLRVGGTFTPYIESLMRAKLNRLLQRELSEKNKKPGKTFNQNFVFKMEEVERKSLYGYYKEAESFAKVYFTNPYYVLKLSKALGKELQAAPGLQPYESHIPYTLQFFIDNSLFGMDFINFSKVLYRITPHRLGTEIIHESLTALDIRNSESLSPLPPVTSCWIECDAFASDIMNSQINKTNKYSTNPGLEYLWSEEAVRCALQNRELKDTFNTYDPRPYFTTRQEKELKKRMRCVARELKKSLATSASATQSTPSSSTYTQMLNDTVASNMDTTFSEDVRAETLWLTQDSPVTPLDDDDEDEIQPKEDEITEEVEEIADDEINGMTMLAALEDKETASYLSQRSSISLRPEESENVQREWLTLEENLPLKVKSEVASQKSQSSDTVSKTMTNKSLHNKMLFTESFLDRTSLGTTQVPDVVVASDGDIAEVAYFSVASLEIIAQSSHEYPNPFTDPIIGVSVCVIPDVCRSLKSSEHVFITTISPDLLPDDRCFWVEDEKQIFEKVIEIVHKCDPEMLLGYDTDRLSWGYLLRRGEVIGITGFLKKLARYFNESSSWKVNESDVTSPDGRILTTVWKVVRWDLALRTYDRCAAAQEVLKRKVPNFTNNVLCDMVEQFDKRLTKFVVHYMLRIAFVDIHILSEMDWFLKNAEMARVYGIQLSEVWNRGSQYRVESMLLRLAHTLGYVAPAISPAQRTQMSAPEQLQLILEPVSKVYHDPVIVLDFQSLYPSMIIAYNYCFSTIMGKVDHLELSTSTSEKTLELGALKYDVDPLTIVKTVASRHIHCSPLSAAFVTKQCRDGLIPIMLREVLGARIMIKNSMKLAKSRRLRRILDARQLALKLVANVTYGYTAANWSGRMPCPELADAILGKGRETLERAIEQVSKGDYGTAQVIYGDTDSMFVLVPGGTLEEAFEIGRRIAADVTNANPCPVTLKLEKVYMGCVLETKKRYAGWMFESESDTGRLDSKGIETIRRDTCPIVSKILGKVLELIFTKRWNSLNLYLDSKLSRLDDLSFHNFVFSKEYRGQYSLGAPVPQKKIAEALLEKNPSHVTLSGERVSYVIVEGHPDATVISCVRSLKDFLDNPQLKIHVSYYVRAHILAALRRVTDLIPLQIVWHQNKPRHCYTPECWTIGRRPWCTGCSTQAYPYVYAQLAVGRNERLLSIARVACKSCNQLGPGHNLRLDTCTNFHCPVRQIVANVMRSEAPNTLAQHSFSKVSKHS